MASQDQVLEAAQRVVNVSKRLQTLEYDLRALGGMHEIADAVRRAYLELATPAVQGPLNHLELENTVELQPGYAE